MTALLRAAHAGPTVAVTALVVVLALGRGLPGGTVLLLLAAVLTGQLSIGWANDLLDRRRDLAVGRRDKPLATGEAAVRSVAVALRLALVATTVLSLLLGPAVALVHLVLVVGSGQAYNLGLKATGWSWVPYAVAFGALPSVVTLAGDAAAPAPLWLTLAGGTLGVAAHVLNVLPDLADDRATGVRGMPHRLGERACRVLAAVLLLAASVAAVAARDGGMTAMTRGSGLVLAVVAGLAVLSVAGRGRAPFRAAVAVALVDAVLVATA